MSAAEVDRVEAIAQAHLSCGYPSRECDPVAAALAARLGPQETAALSRAIEGYHHPATRVLVHVAAKALPSGDPEVPRG